MVRVRRNCSTNDIFYTQIQHTRQRFTNRGYNADILSQAVHRIMKTPRKDTLIVKTYGNNKTRKDFLSFVTRYTAHSQVCICCYCNQPQYGGPFGPSSIFIPKILYFLASGRLFSAHLDRRLFTHGFVCLASGSLLGPDAHDPSQSF
ncbi:hypothetical protein NDU88_004873 [Pleurodeles waltl]|uniref:Uncharacterized protein n=1 Tax=Pleurodeles waltl TaxID=8319 RepID=A0AAV7M8B5_PLEWA|nr:hypothetical protein NDU88_004873 [Pleurodeles waltl]